jgi:hypothetical protein
MAKNGDFDKKMAKNGYFEGNNGNFDRKMEILMKNGIF